MNIKEEIKNKETRYELITGLVLLSIPFISWYAIKIQEWWPVLVFGAFIIIYEIIHIITGFNKKSERKFKLNENKKSNK